MWPDRRRGTALLAGTVLILALGACAPPTMVSRTSGEPSTVPSAEGTPDYAQPAAGPGGPVPTPSPAPTEVIPRAFPHSGPGTFRYAGTPGPILGRGGPVRRFRVAVERNLTTVDLGRLTSKINQVLGDPRSWIASGRVRLQQVPPNSGYDFTIYLASAGTSRRMCASGGVLTRGYTSCRYSGHVVLNLDRWYTSVPYYTNRHVPLDTYRSYMVNHEVGHQLGHGHERCPAAGRPAPVMQQQTLGLHGCTANPWPYLAGRRYAGPPGHY